MNHHVVVVVCVVVVCVYYLPTRFMSSADNLCKQCGPRSGPTGEKVNFEKKSQQTPTIIGSTSRTREKV